MAIFLPEEFLAKSTWELGYRCKVSLNCYPLGTHEVDVSKFPQMHGSLLLTPRTVHIAS